MKNGLSTLFTDVRDFFDNRINIVLIAVIVFSLALLSGQITTNLKIAKLSAQIANTETKVVKEIETNRRKIHFRYFNLTRTLEDVYNVKVNTENGEIKR